MESDQPLIEALEKQKGVLQKQFDKVVQELLYADSSTTVRLEGQRDNLNQKIQEIDKEIKHQAFNNLTAIINRNEIISSKVYTAYKKALKKKQYIPGENLQLTLKELLIKTRDEDSYLDRFVMHLLHLTINARSTSQQEEQLNLLVEIDCLRNWATKNIINYDNLKQKINEEERNSESLQPCLLVRVKEVGTKNKKCCISAWFIKDARSYRENADPSLVTVLTVDSELAIKECDYKEFELKMRELIARCPSYEYELMIQLFLPKTLIDIDIDQWFPGEDRNRIDRRFGILYKIVLRAEKRLDPKYGHPYQQHLRNQWHERWKKIEGKSSLKPFLDFFEDCDPNCPEELIPTLQQRCEALGVKLVHPSSSVEEEKMHELFDILIEETAIPIALWVRQPPGGKNWWEALKDSLKNFSLEELPKAIKDERTKNVRDEQHIGRHLSLLWDDPYLLPPDCSQTFIKCKPN